MDPVDTLVAEIAARAGKDVLERARQVRMLALDVDGVMTGGGLIHGAGGQQIKQFHALDGLGLRLLREAGFELAIITGRRSEVVAERAGEIGASHLFQGQLDKRSAFEQLVVESGIEATSIAFMGDDLIDIPALRRAGLALAVADAHPLVLSHCHWRSERSGGRGATREACELLLHAHGLLADTYRQYLA